MVEYSKFEELGVQVLGVSGEPTFSQKMFAASMKLPYPLLSDFPDFEMIKRYGLLKYIGEAKQPVARATYLLIDKEGVVRQKWLKPKGEVFPNDGLLKAARELAGL